jgi:hypothetical protein
MAAQVVGNQQNDVRSFFNHIRNFLRLKPFRRVGAPSSGNRVDKLRTKPKTFPPATGSTRVAP